MRRTLMLLPAAAALLLLSGDQWPRHADAASPDPTLTPRAASQVVQVDPSTGKITMIAAPTPEDLRATLGEAVSTSGEGLVQEKSPVAGGGVMINLQGRFRNASVATVDAQGHLKAECGSGSPADAAATPKDGKGE
jgi:hypothetical protein